MEKEKKAIVSIVKGYDVMKMVKKAVDLIGGMETIIKKGDRVLIKPNLCTHREPEIKRKCTTSSLVVTAIIELIKEKAGRIVLVESDGFILDATRAFATTGIKEVAERFGIELLNLSKDEKVHIDLSGAKVVKEKEVARAIVECDKIINIPLLKTQLLTEVSISLKNILGLVGEGKHFPYTFHNVIDQTIVDINKSLHQKIALTVIDGIIGHEGPGPFYGTPIKTDLIIASRDLVAADSVASVIMGMNPSKIGHIKLASEQGLGQMRLERIEIKGENIEKVRKKFMPPIFYLAQAFQWKFKETTTLEEVFERTKGNYQVKQVKNNILTSIKTPKDIIYVLIQTERNGGILVGITAPKIMKGIKSSNKSLEEYGFTAGISIEGAFSLPGSYVI